MEKPKLLSELAKECRNVWERACADLGNDLGGHSVLDLCADNITDASLWDLEDAIVAAGISANASPRIQKQIAKYRHENH